jgi:hypothetical protein
VILPKAFRIEPEKQRIGKRVPRSNVALRFGLVLSQEQAETLS